MCILFRFIRPAYQELSTRSGDEDAATYMEEHAECMNVKIAGCKEKLEELEAMYRTGRQRSEGRDGARTGQDRTGQDRTGQDGWEREAAAGSLTRGGAAS
jgi:hypothetical protein